MPKLSFARFNDSAERARSGWAEYASELQHLSPLITELDVVLPQARAASMLHGLKQGEFQQATRAGEGPVACLRHMSSASMIATFLSPASLAPRLAPAIPPPTISTSILFISAAGYGLERRRV